MKIAQIAPLYESVPPKLYGGTERIVHYLTEELINQGHSVTLFATGDSTTHARLVSNVKQGLRLDRTCIDPLVHHIVQMQEVINRAHEFDILHFHTDYLHFPCSARLSVPTLTTLHGRLDIPDLQAVYNMFPNQKVVSISNHQRLPLPQANFVGTVYHGLPKALHGLGSGRGGYLAFLGRISPEKGIDKAIAMAIAANCPLKIAAKIDKADREYFEKSINPLLDHSLIEFIGEINENQKTIFLGNAQALLFPIQWPEPFGLVMIEAMACGTPVIAFNNGSVSEIIENGRNGFIVNSIASGVEAIQALPLLNRQNVRSVFERRFTAGVMTRKYLKLYAALAENVLSPFQTSYTETLMKQHALVDSPAAVFVKPSNNIQHAGKVNPR